MWTSRVPRAFSVVARRKRNTQNSLVQAVVHRPCGTSMLRIGRRRSFAVAVSPPKIKIDQQQAKKRCFSTSGNKMNHGRPFAEPGRPGPGRPLNGNERGPSRSNAANTLAAALFAATIGWAGWMYTQKTGPFQLSKSDDEIAEEKALKEAKLEYQRRKDPANAVVTHHVFLDVSVNGKPWGRIVLGLFGSVTPKTVANFVALASGNLQSTNTTESVNDSKPRSLSLKGSIFHRVIPQFMIQGGDITHGDGTGGFSIYGDQFPDENFDLWHVRPGVVSMANRGPNTNSSQFFITSRATPWLDNNHVVFGIVTDNLRLVHKLERLGTRSGKPVRRIEISDCGTLSEEEYQAWVEAESKRRQELGEEAESG